MPEGDTIHRAASTLTRALAGERVTRFEAPRLLSRTRPEPGDLVTEVEARGKHLLIHFEGADGRPDLALRTHMKMSGSWHLYRPDERWRKSRYAMRVVVGVPRFVAVCFSAPEVEVLRAQDVDAHAALRRLGPDLTRDDIDLDDAVQRLGTLVDGSTEIGVALLDQRIACGVGNVYKSEALHATHLDPFATVAELDVSTRRQLLETASRQLRANLTGYPRTTVPQGLAVYGRNGEPCHRCGGTILVRKQGEHARATYWCPDCQVRPAR